MPKNEKHVFIIAGASSVDIHINGYVGDWGNDLDALRQALTPNVSVINVWINSGGGDVVEGKSMYEVLKKHNASKTAYINGQCASMATIIALACDKIIMDEFALWLIHEPRTVGGGTADQLEQHVEILRQYEEFFIEIYSAKCGKSREEVKSLMQIDAYMTAKQAIEYGFIDEVTTLSTMDMFENFKIAACQNCNIPNNHIMKFSATFFALLALAATSSEAEIESRIKEVIDENKVLKAKLEKQAKDRANQMIEEAILCGKISASEKEIFFNAALNDFEQVKKAIDERPPYKSVQSQLNLTNQAHTDKTDTKNWTFEEWEKNDPKGLSQMSKENPDKFEKLFNASKYAPKFGQ